MPGGVITINIPRPPSANALWRAVNGRNIRSQVYRSWLADAGWVVNLQKPGRIEGPYTMSVTVTRPDKRRRDLSNYLKALEDLLVHLGVITDDHLAQRITLAWSDAEPDPGAMVSVTVEAA